MKLEPLAFFIVALIFLSLMAMSQEIVGGVVGGLVVAILGAITPSLLSKFARFEFKFLDSIQPVRAEGMKKATVLELPSGISIVRFSLRPRVGIRLSRINFAFFEKAKYIKRLWPTFAGARRTVDEIRVTSFRTLHNDGTWSAFKLDPLSNEAMIAVIDGLEFSENSRRVFELEFQVLNRPQWNGIFGIQLYYYHNDNLEMRNLHEAVFTNLSPRYTLFRNVQKANIKPSVPCIPDSQPSPIGA